MDVTDSDAIIDIKGISRKSGTCDLVLSFQPSTAVITKGMLALGGSHWYIIYIDCNIFKDKSSPDFVLIVAVLLTTAGVCPALFPSTPQSPKT